MNLETRIKLDKFHCRPYQRPILDAIENKGYLRVLAVLPRRSGKDITAWNLMLRQALRRIGVYWYILPTYAMGKKIIWDSIDNNGNKFLDYIPSELIDSTNSQEMKVRLKNGSLIQVVGSDNYNALVGTNAIGMVFSEYALQDPMAYQYLRPILVANGGWAVFLSTPRGKNHLYELFEIARNSENWFAYRLTVEDTLHIPLAEIEREKQSGEMSEDLIQQEYYCSWDLGIEGAYYSKYLDRMKVNNQITAVPWEPGFPVHTAWDLGMRDATTIIFFQTIGQTVRIVDYYENQDQGLEHYAKILQQKEYIYGKHIAPHDIAVRELGTGMSRLERARQLGISFIVAPSLALEDGIESVRSTLSKIWIDERKGSRLIKAIENYRKEYDNKNRIYKSHPLHNEWSHGADALRYLCISLPKTGDGTSSAELDKRYAKAMGFEDRVMPSVFRDDLPRY